LQTSSRFELWVSHKAFLGKDFHQKGRQSTTHARRDYLEAPIAVIIGWARIIFVGNGREEDYKRRRVVITALSQHHSLWTIILQA
jgi:hypothetical protein